VGIGATVIERLVIGDGAFIGAGAVVTGNVETRALMVGIAAEFKKSLAGPH
jgi:acetyltransferase-like isoleucine patch superfamily enzyme